MRIKAIFWGSIHLLIYIYPVVALLYFVGCLLGNFLFPFWLSWWIIVPFNILLALPLNVSKGLAFWLGGFASGFSWLGYSLWLSSENEHILAPRLTKILQLPHPILLFSLIFFIPFFVGGISSMTGVMTKKFFFRNANI